MIWNQILTWLEQLFHLTTLNGNQSNKYSGLLIQQKMIPAKSVLRQFPVCLTLSEGKREREIKIWVFFWKELLKVACNKTVKLEARSVLFTLGTRVFSSRATKSFVGHRHERQVTLKTWPKPETAHKKPLDPGYVLLCTDSKKLGKGSPAIISTLLNENW